MVSIRLHVRGKFLGFRRGQRTQRTHTSLIRIEGVNTKQDTAFYMGKRVAYVYKGKKVHHGTTKRVIWGRITTAHGNTGVVRAKFSSNLPPRAMGHTVRVMMYPSRV